MPSPRQPTKRRCLDDDVEEEADEAGDYAKMAKARCR